MWGFKIGHRPSPAREAYQPKFIRGDQPIDVVPKKFRGLRLQRNRKPKMTPTPLIIRLSIAVMIIGFVATVLRVCSVRR
jgi:hypothetical protein